MIALLESPWLRSVFMPQMKLPAWTELSRTHRALDNKKFLDKYFDNVLSLNYLLHLESKVSRDMWVGCFVFKQNQEKVKMLRLI